MKFSFVVENEDFFNWTGSVFALRDTNFSLHQYVEESINEVLDTWSKNERQHINDFITHNLSVGYGTVPHSLHQLKCYCGDCTAIYKRLTAMKTFPDKPLKLEVPDILSKDWWILLKMFLPEGRSNINSLEECDVSSLCDLLEGCQLFDELEKDNLKQIKTCRNKLMHSSSSEISEKQKIQYFDELISMCENRSIHNRIEIQDCVNKLKYDKDNLHRFASPMQEFEEVRDAFTIQENAIKHDLEECKEIKECQLNKSDLEKLLEQVKKNKDMAEDLIGVKGKLVGTLAQAIVKGQEEGGKVFPTFVGKAVGRLAGGAGASVAGRYRMRKQNND